MNPLKSPQSGVTQPHTQDERVILCWFSLSNCRTEYAAAEEDTGRLRETFLPELRQRSSGEMRLRWVCLNLWGLIFGTVFWNRKLDWQQSKRRISSLPFFLSCPRRRSSAALKRNAATLEGPRSSSPAGNQPSFFHEAVSVQERLWISPAAPASNTSCYTLGNMTTALPPSSLHLNTLLYLMTW